MEGDGVARGGLMATSDESMGASSSSSSSSVVRDETWAVGRRRFDEASARALRPAGREMRCAAHACLAVTSLAGTGGDSRQARSSDGSLTLDRDEAEDIWRSVGGRRPWPSRDRGRERTEEGELRWGSGTWTASAARAVEQVSPSGSWMSRRGGRRGLYICVTTEEVGRSAEEKDRREVMLPCSEVRREVVRTGERGSDATTGGGAPSMIGVVVTRRDVRFGLGGVGVSRALFARWRAGVADGGAGRTEAGLLLAVEVDVADGSRTVVSWRPEGEGVDALVVEGTGKVYLFFAAPPMRLAGSIQPRCS